MKRYIRKGSRGWASHRRRTDPDRYDKNVRALRTSLVVGGGPAGLSAAYTAGHGRC